MTGWLGWLEWATAVAAAWAFLYWLMGVALRRLALNPMPPMPVKRDDCADPPCSLEDGWACSGHRGKHHADPPTEVISRDEWAAEMERRYAE